MRPTQNVPNFDTHPLSPGDTIPKIIPVPHMKWVASFGRKHSLPPTFEIHKIWVSKVGGYLPILPIPVLFRHTQYIPKTHPLWERAKMHPKCTNFPTIACHPKKYPHMKWVASYGRKQNLATRIRTILYSCYEGVYGFIQPTRTLIAARFEKKGSTHILKNLYTFLSN